MILVNFFSRSSRATGPKTRVPTGSFASLINYSGIVVKPDVGAILAALLLARADHHRLHHFALLHLAIRRRFFHSRGDHVTQSGRQTRIAADRQDAGELAGAGIIGHRQPCSHLNHFRAPLNCYVRLSVTRVERVTTSFSRQRFSFESGRVETMRTVSPTRASPVSSCA